MTRLPRFKFAGHPQHIIIRRNNSQSPPCHLVIS